MLRPRLVWHRIQKRRIALEPAEVINILLAQMLLQAAIVFLQIFVSREMRRQLDGIAQLTGLVALVDIARRLIGDELQRVAVDGQHSHDAFATDEGLEKMHRHHVLHIVRIDKIDQVFNALVPALRLPDDAALRIHLRQQIAKQDVADNQRLLIRKPGDDAVIALSGEVINFGAHTARRALPRRAHQHRRRNIADLASRVGDGAGMHDTFRAGR